MDIKIKCPSCAKAYRVPAAAAGKAFRCKQCGGAIRVPKQEPLDEPIFDEPIFDDEPATPPPALQPQASPRPADEDAGPGFEPFGGFEPGGKPKRSVSMPNIDVKALAGLGVAGVVLLVLVIAFLMTKGDGPSETAEQPGQRAGLALNTQNKPGAADAPAPITPPITPPIKPTAPQNQPEVAPEDDRSAKPAPPPKPEYNPEPDAKTIERFTFPRAPFKPGTEALQHTPIAPMNGWAVKPDPPEGGFKIHPKLNLHIGKFTTLDMIWPDTYSPFMIVGNNSEEKSKRVIVDLRSASVLWEVKGKLEGTKDTALSPDGQYFALLVSKGEGTGLFVVSSRHMRGYPVGKPMAGTTGTRSVLFALGSRLLLCEPEGKHLGRVTAFDPKTRKQLWQAAIANGPVAGFTRSNRVLSPNGKYLAIPVRLAANRLAISLIDTTTGEVRGALRTPATDNGLACDSLAFSPDGSRLVASFDRGKTLGLWDLNSGRSLAWTAVETELVKKNIHNRNRIDKLEPLVMLDNTGLVMRGNTKVYDAERGMGMIQKQVNVNPDTYTTQSFSTNPTRGKGLQPLHGSLYITSQRGKDSRGNSGQMLGHGRFDIEQLRTALASQTVWADELEDRLPLLDQSFFTYNDDTGYFKPASRRDAFPLRFEPAPVPEAAGGVVKIPAPTAEPHTAIRRPFTNDVKQLRVTNADREGNLIARLKDGRVFRLSNTEATPAEPVGLPSDGVMPMWLSEDGERMLGRVGRYRVCHFDLNSGELLGSWRVMHDPEDNKTRNINTIQLDAVQSAALVNGNRLWVYTFDGTAALIDTEQNMMLASAQIARGGIQNLTPDSRHLLLAHQGQVLLINANTGEAEGIYDIGEGSASVVYLSPSGTKAAVFVKSKYMTDLVVIDVRENKVLSRAPMPPSQGTIDRLSKSVHEYGNQDPNKVTKKRNHVTSYGWCDDRYMILGPHVVDTQTGRHLWRFEGDHRLALAGVVNGRGLWQLTSQDNRTTQLLSSRVPHNEMFLHLAANPNVATEPPMEVGPGKRVRIELSGIRYAQEMRENIGKRLTEAGLIVDDSAPLKLRISYKQKSETEEYRGLDGDGRLTKTSMSTVAQWIDKDGRVLWADRYSGYVGAGSFFTVRVERGESALEKKRRELADNVDRQQQRDFKVPVLVPASPTRQVLGTSTLTEEGFVEPPADDNPS